MFDFVKRVFLGLVHSVGAVFATNREAVVESGDGYIRYSIMGFSCAGERPRSMDLLQLPIKESIFHRRSKAAPLLFIQRMILM